MPRLLYFSVLREKIGTKEEEIEFKGPVKELREVLKNRYPQAGEIIDRVRFAVNEEYVDESFLLKGDETVALIPPVSGG